MINDNNILEFTNGYVPPEFLNLGLPGSHEKPNKKLIEFITRDLGTKVNHLRPEGVSLLPHELLFYTHTIEKFLEEKKDIRLLEHGSGSSTLYLSLFFNIPRSYEYSTKITSFETNEFWFSIINLVSKKINSTNLKLVLNEKYSWSEILKKENKKQNKKENKKYNVVMIDGRRRLEFSEAMLDFIEEDSLIFLHDYHPGSSRDAEFNFLKSRFEILGIVKNLVCFRGKLNV